MDEEYDFVRLLYQALDEALQLTPTLHLLSPPSHRRASSS